MPAREEPGSTVLRYVVLEPQTIGALFLVNRNRGAWYPGTVVLGAQVPGTVVLSTQEAGTVVLGTQEPGTLVLGTQGIYREISFW